MKIVIIYYIVCVWFKLGLAQEPIVTTSLGDVMGTTWHSPNRQSFHAFLGIRYAESPAGELRWKAPVPVKPWNDVFDARKDGPACHQHTYFGEKMIENIDLSEDCLRINVFTRNLNASNDNLWPVIVDIHGGAFVAGGSHTTFIKPLYLLDHDVLFVTMNYRLGVLGFLSAGTKEIPGNAGLKDQVEALKWVQNNIRSFGGDPNNVTIMGYSAGGYSVAGHLVSPMSSGLFHRALPISGAITTHFLLPENHQLDFFNRIANELNCSFDSISETTSCLRSKPGQDLEKVLEKFFEAGFCPMFTLVPVLESDFGQERFFIEQPITSIQSGNFNKVPVMTGMAKDEFASAAYMILKNDTALSKMKNNWYELAPTCFMYEKSTPRSKNISDIIRKAFVPVPLGNTIESLIELQKVIRHVTFILTTS